MDDKKPFNPGDSFSPGNAPSAAPAPTQPAPNPVAPLAPPADAFPAVEPTYPAAPQQQAEVYYDNPVAPDAAQPGDAASQAPPPPPEYAWEAAEFVSHPKTTQWYAAFVVVCVAALAVAYLITRDVTTVIVIAIMAGLFGYMANRQPQRQSYGVSSVGVYIGNRFYPFSDFKGFSVVQDGNSPSVDLLPLKRFAPMVSMSYSLEDETRILDILVKHLPFDHQRHSAIDGLMHRIGF